MAKEDLVVDAGEKQEPAPRLALTFAELGICKELVEACDLMGWKEPTRVQAEARFQWRVLVKERICALYNLVHPQMACLHKHDII